MGDEPTMLPPDVVARIFAILEEPAWSSCPQLPRPGSLLGPTYPELVDWAARVRDWSAARGRTMTRGDLVKAAVAIGVDTEIVARIWRFTEQEA